MIRVPRLHNLLNKVSRDVVKSLSFCSGQSLKDVDEEEKTPTHHPGVAASDNFMNMSGNVQVALIGGGSTPIYVSAILKQYPMVRCVHLIDTKNNLAKAARDVTFIDTSTKVKYYTYSQLTGECLTEELYNMDVVAIMDEDDYKPRHATPQEQFCASTSHVLDTAKTLAVVCPKALVAVFARPVTANTPLVYECYTHYGRCEPHKIVGSVALETMRIESATAELLGLDASCMSIPVVAGADVVSSVPLLSRAKAFHKFSRSEEEYLLDHLRSSDRVVCKHVPTGPIFSTAISSAKFILTLVSGLAGNQNATTNAFVRSGVMPLCKYFSSQVSFGTDGVCKIHDIPEATKREQELLEDSLDTINECEYLARDLVYRQFLKENKCNFRKSMKCS